MKCQKITLINKLGLHARASARFVSVATEFKSEILIKRDTQQVNGKSIMCIMMLAAAKGTELEVCAEGPDAAKAIAALAELVNDYFGEGE